MQLKIRNFFLSLLLILGCSPTFATPTLIVDNATLNTTNEIATSHKNHRLLYTIHALSAVLQADNRGNLQLVLQGVTEQMNYRNNFKQNKKIGLTRVGNFIEEWNSNGPEKVVEVDLTGVQVNNNTMGHTQFYASTLLGKPTYDPARHELIFNFVKLLTKVNLQNHARFDNATLFLNGCNLCDCERDAQQCIE